MLFGFYLHDSLMLLGRKVSSRKELILQDRVYSLNLFFFLFTAETGLLIIILNQGYARLRSSNLQTDEVWRTQSKFPGQHLSTAHLPVPSPELILCQVHFLKLCRAEGQSCDSFKPKTGLLVCGIPCMQTYRHYNIDTGRPWVRLINEPIFPFLFLFPWLHLLSTPSFCVQCFFLLFAYHSS